MRVDGRAHTAHPSATASEISRGIVRLNANLYGRGPIRAKTYVNDETVVCVLESVLTTAERTLIDIGRSDEVKRSRAAFSEATEEQFCEIVANATGRRVRGCVQGVHTGLDTVATVFFLGPRSSGNGGRPVNS